MQEMSWINNTKLQEYIRKSGLELLRYYQTEEWKSLEVYGHHKNTMLMLSIALITGGLTAVSINNTSLMMIGAYVPVLVVVMRYYMIRFLDRYYARFLESVVSQRKLRFIFGMSSETNPPFLTDRDLLVPRRSGVDPGSAESTVWVRKYLTKGHNEVISQFMSSLVLFSLILPVAVSIRLFNDGFTTIGSEAIVIIPAISILFTLLVYWISNIKIGKNRDQQYGSLNE